MKFYGQWNPPVDRVLYENYFKNKKGGFFIESGASDGNLFSCCKFFEEEFEWTGINVEPSKSYKNLVKNRPKCININVGLSDKEETLTFKNVIPKGRGGLHNGSFHHTAEHLLELKNYGATFEEFNVKTTTYSKLIAEYNIDNVDLMCLDVEGFEFKVIDGMSETSILPKVICIEYSYLGLKNVIDYLKKLNYVFDFISHNNAFFHHSSFAVNNKHWFGKTEKECSVKNGKIIWK